MQTSHCLAQHRWVGCRITLVAACQQLSKHRCLLASNCRQSRTSPPHLHFFCCCSQNEVEYEDAVKLVNKGVKIILEGANMPSNSDAIAHFHKCGVVLAAAKACNAGGVAVSGLEMAQNACMSVWATEEVDNRLKVLTMSASLVTRACGALEALTMLQLHIWSSYHLISCPSLVSVMSSCTSQTLEKVVSS